MLRGGGDQIMNLTRCQSCGHSLISEALKTHKCSLAKRFSIGDGPVWFKDSNVVYPDVLSKITPINKTSDDVTEPDMITFIRKNKNLIMLLHMMR